MEGLEEEPTCAPPPLHMCPFGVCCTAPLHADNVTVHAEDKKFIILVLACVLAPIINKEIERYEYRGICKKTATLYTRVRVCAFAHMCVLVCVCVCVRTYEARWGRIGLDVLLSVALNQIPESPHIAGVKDVEELVRMDFAVLHVWSEQVVVRTGVPLRNKWGGALTPQFRPQGRPVLSWKYLTFISRFFALVHWQTSSKGQNGFNIIIIKCQVFIPSHLHQAMTRCHYVSVATSDAATALDLICSALFCK